MGYNIPKVVTSIVDQSALAPAQSGGRVVLVPYFSKYGPEEFKSLYSQFSKAGEHIVLGKENRKKYGDGVFYIKGALSVPFTEVLGKRLLPEDATYANTLLTIADDTKIATTSSVSSSTKEGLFTNLLSSRFGIFAKNRGVGYNDIIIEVRRDVDTELFFATDEGVPIYPFNFFTATVYENGENGLTLFEENIRFSLLETDKSGSAFIDPITGGNLFFENIESEYIEMRADQDMVDSLDKLINMEDVRSTFPTEATPVLKDSVTGLTYELNELGGELVANRVVSDTSEDSMNLVSTDAIPSVIAISIQNKQIVVSDLPDILVTPELAGYGIVQGELGFVKFTVLSLDKVIVIGDNIQDSRTEITGFLTKQKYVNLSSGFDGSGIANGSRFNMSGTVEAGSSNGESLLVTFYEQTTDLYETIFPSYQFDYVPDWSSKDNVKSAINSLTTNIGIALGLVSATYASNAESDLEWRQDVFYASNMHTAIYSGQSNTAHYHKSTKSNITVPSSYYAMIKHLITDNNYSITEPVANITKGQLPVAGAKMSYVPIAAQIEKLLAAGINPVVIEKDGKYFVHQLTSLKKSSKLTRINNVKTLHAIRKALPPLLKDLLQLKATDDVITTAGNRVTSYMNKWIVGPNNISDGIFTTVSVSPYFNANTNELTIFLNVVFIGVIESISIPIIVK